MIYIRRLFNQDLRSGKQIAFPKEPSYTFFKFDYKKEEPDRQIKFIYSPIKNDSYNGQEISTRLYSDGGGEARIDGQLKAFIRDKLKVEINDFLIFVSNTKNSDIFKFYVVKKQDSDLYEFFEKITNSENHTILLKDDTQSNSSSSTTIPYPRNRIIFGAPGTGKSFRLNKEANESNFAEITRVTFHPDYSYSQFVGTYKPVMVKNESRVADENVRQTLEILQDKTKTAQEKYDLLYDKFKNENNLTRLPILVALYCDEPFTPRDQEGNSAAANHTSFETNHGKAIRPYINLKSQNDNATISYKYVPGPFLRTLVATLKSGKSCNPQNYLLIIEEINRARVAAVFGDVFQLLDRKANGESEYEIQTSEDLRNFLAEPEQLGGKPDDYKTLKLPNNFYIWATMNSADQGVFPMDTAFKRRWNFEYIGIDEEVTDCDSDSAEEKEQKEKMRKYEIPLYFNKSENNWMKVNWNDLRKAINAKLISANVNEDKLLGPYFISESDLIKANNSLKSDDEKSKKAREDFIKLFKSKVIMYLFEDAAKMKRDFFKLTGGRKYIYSDVCKELDEKGIEVFNFSEEEKGNLKEEEIPKQVRNDTSTDSSALHQNDGEEYE